MQTWVFGFEGVVMQPGCSSIRLGYAYPCEARILLRMRFLIVLLGWVALPAFAGVADFCGPEASGLPGEIQIAWIKWLVTALCVFVGVGALLEREWAQSCAFFSIVAVAHLFPVFTAGMVMLGIPVLFVIGVMLEE